MSMKSNYSSSSHQHRNADLLILFLHGELLLFDLFQLITEVEFGRLLLKLGEFVLVFRHLSQGWFDTAIYNECQRSIIWFKNKNDKHGRAEHLQFTAEVVNEDIDLIDLLE